MVGSAVNRAFLPAKSVFEQVGELVLLTGRTIASAVRPPYPYGEEFIGQFLTINTHPALSPAFPGMQGPAEALAYGVKITGATLFVVDAGVDTGAVIDQVAVRVEDGDDVESLHERIKVAERAMLVENVGRIGREGIKVDGRSVRFGG